MRQLLLLAERRVGIRMGECEFTPPPRVNKVWIVIWVYGWLKFCNYHLPLGYAVDQYEICFPPFGFRSPQTWAPTTIVNQRIIFWSSNVISLQFSFISHWKESKSLASVCTLYGTIYIYICIHSRLLVFICFSRLPSSPFALRIPNFLIIG